MILSSRTVKIRKPCKCFGCDREFPIGTRLRKLALKEYGEFAYLAYCKTCDTYWERYLDDNDEIGQGDLRYENFEEWEKIRKEVEIEEG